MRLIVRLVVRAECEREEGLSPQVAGEHTLLTVDIPLKDSAQAQACDGMASRYQEHPCFVAIAKRGRKVELFLLHILVQV